ncbi:MAG: carboxypeptidase regulatory-like domain-containing protein [Planctomycetaceae bacterium]|nr:carboxypeptidase regulatory-like domain-containing protein [Planctomycetaceae bacterium]
MRRNSLFAALLFAFAYPAFTQESVTLKGKVTGPGDAVVEGAILRLYRISMEGQIQMNYLIAPVAETKSDAQGTFSFTVENQQTAGTAFYTCIASKDGLSCGWKSLLEDRQDLDIQLTEPQKMIGFVLDPDGRAVSGAEVRLALIGIKGDFSFTIGLEPIDNFVTRTCDQGRFEFNTLPEGSSAEILVKKDGRGILHTFTADVSPEGGLTYQAGQTEIMLTAHRPCKISGVVLDKEGGPVEGISVSAVQENIPVNLLGIGPAVSSADGTFEISQLPPGKYNLVVNSQDWIASPVSLDVQGNVGAKIELQKGGVLEVKVLDGSTQQPLEKSSITIRSRDNSHTYFCNTDASGTAKKQLLPGNYEVSARHPGFQGAQNGAVAVIENEKTAAIEIQLSGQQKLTGIVKGPDGKPAKDISIRIMPNQGMRQNIKTDDEGRFTVAWNPEEMSWVEGDFLLAAVDEKNKLAKIEPINAETKDVAVTLQPGCTVKGKVLSEEGKPLKDAEARLTIQGRQWGESYGEAVKSDDAGEYVFSSLPTEQEFYVNVSGVKGYGSGSKGFSAEADAVAMAVEDITLRVANLTLTGQAVDAEGKGLADVRMQIYGDGQPNDNVVTDKDGNFKFEYVCPGSVQVHAYAQLTPGNYIGRSLRTEGGAEGVVIVLSQRGGSQQYEPKKPAPLVGKDLPDLSGYGVEVPADANSILVFVWDMQQRPSRHFVQQLAAKQESLLAKNIKVILLNASKVEKEPLQQWLAENKIPYACGIMSVDPDNAMFNLGVQGLPWLILTDNAKKVTAEGFAVEDLDDKIKSL